MKKVLLSILIAIIIGFSFGYIFLKRFNMSKVSTSDIVNIYAFQVGVYKNYNNALNVSNINNGIIINDNDSYRVYSAFLSDMEIVNNLKEYYKTNNINYYLKQINVSNDTLTIINDYEILLKKASIDKYPMIIKELMKELEKNEL